MPQSISLQKLWIRYLMLSDAKQYNHIRLAYSYTDLCFGVDGLSMIIEDSFWLDAFKKGVLFVFCSRRAYHIKILLWEESCVEQQYNEIHTTRILHRKAQLTGTWSILSMKQNSMLPFTILPRLQMQTIWRSINMLSICWTRYRNMNITQTSLS